MLYSTHPVASHFGVKIGTRYLLPRETHLGADGQPCNRLVHGRGGGGGRGGRERGGGRGEK